MRQAITISFTPETLRDVRREMKRDSFNNTSEFFRHVFRQWQQNRLLKEIRQGQRDLRAGKGKVLRSLKDLR